MIDIDRIESEKEHLKKKYYSAKPFPFLILKDICDTAKINELYLNIPELENKSRDFHRVVKLKNTF